MTVVSVPTFGFDYMPATYYGWWHSVHVGWWLIFWGKMTMEEIVDEHERRTGK